MASTALMWLAHAPRTLQFSELLEAAIIDPGIIGLDHEVRWQRQDLLEVIGSLVVYSAENDSVSLAHHSVKEYLASEHVKQHAPLFHISPETAGIRTAETCLTYLMMRDFDSGPTYQLDKYVARVRAFPFLQYAARFWPLHAKPYLSRSKEVYQLTCHLLHPSRHPNFRAWLEAMISTGYFNFEWLGKPLGSAFSRYPPRFTIIPTHLTPLYYAASFGLYEIVEYLLENGVDIDEAGGLYEGTALHAAVWRSHKDIVKLLLESGARTDVKDGNGMTPLDMEYGDVICRSLFPSFVQNRQVSNDEQRPLDAQD